MAYTFQKLSAYQKWSVVGATVVEPISNGDFIDNQTQPGTGIITVVTRAAFGVGAVAAIEFLVLSGAFAAGDQIDTNEGGTVFLTGTVTPSTVDTILVDGTQETDSTADTAEAIDAIETDWTVTASAPFSAFEYIKCDGEYCLVTAKPNATTLTVVRGRLGSAAATHTTAADLYIAEKNSFKAIADESITQAWGLATISNGKIEITARFIIGRPDQTGPTVFVSNFESVKSHGLTHFIMGAPADITWFEAGIGSIDTEENGYKGATANGSILDFTGGTFTGYMDAVFNMYSSTYKGAFSYNAESNFKRMSFDAGTSQMGGSDVNKLIDCYVANSTLVPGSLTTVWDDIVLELAGIFYFGSGGAATVRNVRAIDGIPIGAFFAGGAKTYINCDHPFGQTGGSNSVSSLFKYTLHLVFTDLEGAPVPGVDVRVYQKSNGALFNSALSDIDGEISEDVERAFASLAAGDLEYGPFRVYAQLEGWNTWIHDFSFDDKKRVDDVVVLVRSPYAGIMAQGIEAV